MISADLFAEARRPKRGEVWIDSSGNERTIWSCDDENVAWEFTNGVRRISPLYHFVSVAKPAPTRVGSRWLDARRNFVGGFATAFERKPCSTHRLDLMSDGTFRVVTL